MRWNTRSAPVRSPRTSMPPNLSLKVAAIFSDTDRSIEVYQTTLPSFFAASISCGVIASAGGASARTRDANMVPSASAVEPFSTVRREIFLLFIAVLPFGLFLSAQRAAALGWQNQPDLIALGYSVVRCRDHAQRGAVRGLDH